MKNFSTVKSELKEKGISLSDLHYYVDAIEYSKKRDSDRKLSEREEELKAIVGDVGMAEHYGGEGQGEIWYSVINFKDFGFFGRIDAWYQSYDGIEWSGATFKEVKPEVITKTIYK